MDEWKCVGGGLQRLVYVLKFAPLLTKLPQSISCVVSNKYAHLPDKNKKTGRVTSVWPGSALHYMEAIKDPRFEDFEIKYHSGVSLPA